MLIPLWIQCASSISQKGKRADPAGWAPEEQVTKKRAVLASLSIQSFFVGKREIDVLYIKKYGILANQIPAETARPWE